MCVASTAMEKLFLVLPVNDNKEKKHYRLLKNGKLVYDFNSALDFDTPVFMSYCDITRIGGNDLSLTDDNGNEVPITLSDRFPTADEIKNHEFLRPAAHYTTSLGWTNDPNGLIYVGGKYHMFYQHNPHGINWGNMTWGHAVSDDLVHWEETGDILFPDEFGTMYSGSALCDHENAAGFGKDAILLFYTAAGGENELSNGVRYSQCLAYSTDCGKTFTKYAKNPIIPHITAANRDPKVIWSDEVGRYILSLYLDGNDYAIFASDNLIDWEKLSDVRMPADNECPDFYPLTVRETGAVHWVFSGAHDTYIVGDLTKDGFKPIDSFRHYHRDPGVSYAAQTFSGCGDRRIKIAWDRASAPGAVFNCQMGLPVEMFLRQVDDVIRLGSYPVAEVDTLVKDSFFAEIDSSADFSMDALSMGAAADVTLKIGSETAPFVLSVFGMEISVNPVENTYTHGNCTAPLSYSGEKTLRVIFDTLGAEIFADHGLIYSTIGQIADRSRGICIASAGSVSLKLAVTALSMK